MTIRYQLTKKERKDEERLRIHGSIASDNELRWIGLVLAGILLLACAYAVHWLTTTHSQAILVATLLRFVAKDTSVTTIPVVLATMLTAGYVLAAIQNLMRAPQAEENLVSISDTGVSREQGGNRILYSWDLVRSTAQDEKSIAIVIDPLNSMLIPKRAFDTIDDCQAFWTEIDTLRSQGRSIEEAPGLAGDGILNLRFDICRTDSHRALRFVWRRTGKNEVAASLLKSFVCCAILGLAFLLHFGVRQHGISIVAIVAYLVESSVFWIGGIGLGIVLLRNAIMRMLGPDTGGLRHLEVTDSGVVLKAPKWRRAVEWDRIVDIAEYAGDVFLVCGKWIAVMVPRSTFADDEVRKGFVDNLRRLKAGEKIAAQEIVWPPIPSVVDGNRRP